MNFSLDKKKFVNVLFGAAIFLLAANLIISKVLKKNYVHNEDKINVAEINQKFLTSVYDFGIEKQWVHVKKIEDNSADSLINLYSVDVPKDLPIAEILQEIFSTFYNENVQMVCHEKTIGGINSITIYSNDRAKLKALFEYRDDVKRNAGDIALIISGLENLNENKISNIILAPENFTAELVPSKKTIQLADSLFSNRKQYVVLLNDDIQEMNFKLQPNFPEDRLNNAVRAIIGGFPNALFFVVDDNSRLYKSKAFTFIKNLLNRSSIKIITESSFISVSGNVKDNFRAAAFEIKGGKKITIELPAEDYFSVKQDINALIKVGYKFVSPVKTGLQQ